MNPYSEYLGNREPIEVLSETVEKLPQIVKDIGGNNINRQLITGKWTANEILRHLTHVEMLHPSRIRFALTTENFVVQPFDQDKWMNPNTSWETTLNAFFASAEIQFNFISKHCGRREKASGYAP